MTQATPSTSPEEEDEAEDEDEEEDEAEVFPVVLVSNLLLTLFDDVTTSCLSAL